MLKTAATWNTPEYTKAKQRLKRLSTHEVLNQIEASCLEMDKALYEYRKHGDYAAVRELTRLVSILQAAIECIYDDALKF